MPTDTVHVPPQAVEAEMALLGSMLIESEAASRALEYIRPDSAQFFYKDAHRRVFQAIVALMQQSKAVDVVTVGEELSRLKVLEQVGGKEYLRELVNSVATAAHVEHYARVVREKGVLRELIKVSTDTVGECYAESKEPQVILDEAQSRVMAVADQQSMPVFYGTKQLAHEVIQHIEQLHQHKGDVIGVPTGITNLDKKLAGLQPGQLIILAGRTSQGKTAFALNIASYVTLHQKKAQSVAVFSIEMGRQELMQRLIASEAGVNLQDVRTGWFRRDRWADLTTAAARLSEAPLFIDDSSSVSVLDVRSRARRLASDLKSQGRELSLIIVDYLQLMRSAIRRPESRQQEVAEISRGLKQLARDLRVPVIALSQLSRRAEEKGRTDNRPMLSDLRESGALEQDADVVLFVYRESYYKRDDPALKGKGEIIVGKQRNGPTGKVDVAFREEIAKFDNLTIAADTEDAEEASVTF